MLETLKKRWKENYRNDAIQYVKEHFQRELSGKIVVITGPTSGVGKAIAKFLEEMNVTVIYAGRNEKKLAAAVQGKLNAIPMVLDLSDFDSIQNFAETFSSEYGQLHFLLLNAAQMVNIDPSNKTKNGLEGNWGVNVAGNFLLLHGLLSTILSTKGARVIGMTSSLHTQGDVVANAEDPFYKTREGTSLQGYSDSKMALMNLVHGLNQLIFTNEDADKQAIAVDVGNGESEIFKFADDSPLVKMMAVLMNQIARPAEAAAIPVLYGMFADIPKGNYVVPKYGIFGLPVHKEPTPAAMNDEHTQIVWNRAENDTGVQLKKPTS